MKKELRPNTVSIVIPVYNEEGFIETVLDQVKKSDTLGLKKEIIVVNDGSKDGTKKILEGLQKSGNKNTLLKIINKRQNQGKGAALKDGFIASTGDIVIVQDGDLEYNPDDYPALLGPFIDNKADVVYGSRLISDKPHRVLYFWHYLTNVLLTTLSNMLTNLNLTDMETGYKAFRGGLIREIAPMLVSKRFGFEPEITARIARVKHIRIYEVSISYFGRTYEEGKKIGWKDGVRAIWEIIRFNLISR